MTTEQIIKKFREESPFEEKQKETYRGELDVKKIYENEHRMLRNRLRYDLELFLRATYPAYAKEFAEKCLPEEKELPRRFDCPDCITLCKELDRDDATCAICNGKRGFNSAIGEMCEKINRDNK